MMTIHFNADLRSVVGERVGMLHWVMDPAAAGFIIGYSLSGNQVLISNFDVSTIAESRIATILMPNSPRNTQSSHGTSHTAAKLLRLPSDRTCLLMFFRIDHGFCPGR